MKYTDSDPEIREALTELPAAARSEDFFHNLRDNLETIPAPQGTTFRHSHRRALYAAPLTAAAVAAVVFLATLSPGESPKSKHDIATGPTTTQSTQPQLLLAAQVIERGTNSLAGVKTVTGTMTDKKFRDEKFDVGDRTTTTEFRLNDSGDLWQKAACDYAAGSLESSYRAADGNARFYATGRCNPWIDLADYSSIPFTNMYVGEDGKPKALEISNSVDTNSLYRLGNFAALASSLQSLAVVQSPSFVDATYNGRSTWQLEADVDENHWDFTPANHVKVMIDKETFLPISVLRSYNGKPVEQISIDNITTNARLVPEQLTVQYPVGVEVGTRNDSYRRVPLREVQATVGYEPLVPSWLPDGYTLSTTSVITYAGSSGKDSGNQVNENLVWQTYRRGLQTVVVTTRSTGSDPESWVDPFGYQKEKESPITTSALKGGAFSGVSAQVKAQASNGPHLWAVGKDLVLTVSGDANEAEMVRVAESMRTYDP